MEPKRIKWWTRIKWWEHFILPLIVTALSILFTFYLTSRHLAAQHEADEAATQKRHADQMRQKDKDLEQQAAQMKQAADQHAEQIATLEAAYKMLVDATNRQTDQSARDESTARDQRAREAQADEEREAADRVAAVAAATEQQRQQRKRDWEGARARLIVATRTLYAAERRLANPECVDIPETTTTYWNGLPYQQTSWRRDCSAAENAARRDVGTARAEFAGLQSQAARLAPEPLKSRVIALSALFASTNPGCVYAEPVRTPGQAQAPVVRCPRTSEGDLDRAIAEIDTDHFW
jgi:hypothetical protein